MSQFEGDQDFYAYNTWENQQNYRYDAQAPQNFGVPQQFGNFDYSSKTDGTAYGDNTSYMSNQSFAGTILNPQNVPLSSTTYNSPDDDEFANEPPLLEELGINFDHIMQKTMAVLNPIKDPDPAILNESDLAGPLVFCLAFGTFLLLGGKVHFGYIYGIGVTGCLALYALLNLMSGEGIKIFATVSVMGYCLLPMVMLSGVSTIFSLKGTVGTSLSLIVVLWCALSASKLFVTALAMDHQQPLVLYPCALVYGVFALLTIF